MIHCFYHGADFDGYCSGAIVGLANNWDVEFYPMNHGDAFPWDKIKENDTVYIVDYVLNPFVDMVKLNTMCKLIWIDHHGTAIKDYNEFVESRKEKFPVDFFSIAGIRKEGDAACELVWDYFNTNVPTPYAVYLLGRFDVWKHHDVPDCIEFQYGCQQISEPHPTNHDLWDNLIIKEDRELIDHIINNGKTVLQFTKTRNAKLCEQYAFETEIDGHPAIALNKGISSSLAFESVWDKEKYDFMISFSRAKGQWYVSLYTDKEGLDGSVIAKRYGGGGHPGACGFQCQELPFEH